jgi:hypothetical protein
LESYILQGKARNDEEIALAVQEDDDNSFTKLVFDLCNISDVNQTLGRKARLALVKIITQK